MSGFDSYRKYSPHTSSRKGGEVKHRNNSSSSSNNSAGRSNNSSSKKTTFASVKRQRMPLGGGYGGMFTNKTIDNDSSADHTSYGGGGDGSLVESQLTGTTGMSSGISEGSSKSSLSSVFSLASKLFSNKRYSRRNPYSTTGQSTISGNSRNSRSTWQSSETLFHNSFLMKASRFYINLPFRIRYFIQLLSIVGVFCLASLNYFIAMESNPTVMRSIQLGTSGEDGNGGSLFVQDNIWMEGGGSRTHHIPKLRVRPVDPIKFLHEDLHHSSNELLERAKEKFRSSSRFGHQFGDPDLIDADSEDMDNENSDGSNGIEGMNLDNGGGPFKYGWKSMPRQIYNDFSTGISDDTKTIENPNNKAYFLNKAQHKGFNPEALNVDELDNMKNRPPPKGTVAYVLPITTCYAQDPKDTESMNYHPYSPNHPKTEASFRDFAMMLRAMIHAYSYQNPASKSVYDYKMHAIIHPRAKKCRSVTEDLFHVRDGSEGGLSNGLEDDLSNKGMVDRSVVLQQLGYHTEIKYPPLNKDDIQGSDMVQNVDLKDLIQLYAYELEEYDAVVMVDYDTLMVGNVDKAIDLIVDSTVDADDDSVLEESNSIDAVFSWEHVPSIAWDARASVINMSFFLLRPSKATFQKLLLRYQNAQFNEPRGWGNIGRGSFPGWMTTLGFLTYYFDEVANAAKMEINRCAYGNTGEKFTPENSVLITNGGKVDCRDEGQADDSQCKECSDTRGRYVMVADLSYCRAPWICSDEEDEDTNNKADTSDKLLSSKLCRNFHKTWFRGRLQMEDVHPQLEKGNGKLCVNGEYQPMNLLQPKINYRPKFIN